MRLAVFSLILSLAGTGSAFAGKTECAPSLLPTTLNPDSVRLLEKLHFAFLKSVPPLERNDFTCDLDLEKLQSSLRNWEEAPPIDFDLIKKEEAGWLETRPDNTADPCAEDGRLKERTDFLSHASSRYDSLDLLVSQYEDTRSVMSAEKNIFTNKEKAKRLLRCLDDLGLSNDASDDQENAESDESMQGLNLCVEETGASDELLQDVILLDRSGAKMAAGLSCLLDPKAEKLVKQNLAITDALQNKLKKSADEANLYIAWAKERFPKYSRLTGAFRFPFRKLACEKKQNAERTRLKLSVLHLIDAKESSGTGFLVHGASGDEMVTARHVGFEEGVNPKAVPGLKTSPDSPRGRAVAMKLTVSPGNYDHGNDIVKTKAGKLGKALEVVGDEEQLKSGDKVTLLGYPANRNFAFTKLTCEVLGIGREDEEDDRSAAYVLRCPGAESHIAGMSGGPVLNQEGKVVGVISAHNFLDHHVIVRPLSKNEKGEIKIGFQKIFQASRCFEGSFGEPHPCQVIPGLTFQEYIP